MSSDAAQPTAPAEVNLYHFCGDLLTAFDLYRFCENLLLAFEEWEHAEMAMFPTNRHRDLAIAGKVLRALGDPTRADSLQVLKVLLARHQGGCR